MRGCCVRVTYHRAVTFLCRSSHGLLFVSPSISTARDFRSADDGSRGAAVALGDLHTDSRPACGTARALLLAKGTKTLLNINLDFRS